MRGVIVFAIGLDDSGREKLSSFLKERGVLKPVSYEDWAAENGYGKEDLNRDPNVKKEWLKHIVNEASQHPAICIICDDMNRRKQRSIYINLSRKLRKFTIAHKFLCLGGRGLSQLGLEKFDCVEYAEDPTLDEGFDVISQRFSLTVSLAALARRP